MYKHDDIPSTDPVSMTNEITFTDNHSEDNDRCASHISLLNCENLSNHCFKQIKTSRKNKERSPGKFCNPYDKLSVMRSTITIPYRYKKKTGKRYNRWLNQRLLLGNLRQVMLTTGEDFGNVHVVVSLKNDYLFELQNTTDYNCSLNSYKFEYRAPPSYWTRLREDWDVMTAFRKRQEDIYFTHKKADVVDIRIPLFIEDKDQYLQNRIHSVFREMKQTLMYGPSFVLPFLESLENVMTCVLYSSSHCQHVPAKNLNLWTLHNSSVLYQANEIPVWIKDQVSDKKQQIQLVLSGLSPLHRKLTYHLCKVYGLPFYSVTVPTNEIKTLCSKTGFINPITNVSNTEEEITPFKTGRGDDKHKIVIISRLLDSKLFSYNDFTFFPITSHIITIIQKKHHAIQI